MTNSSICMEIAGSTVARRMDDVHGVKTVKLGSGSKSMADRKVRLRFVGGANLLGRGRYIIMRRGLRGLLMRGFSWCGIESQDGLRALGREDLRDQGEVVR